MAGAGLPEDWSKYKAQPSSNTKDDWSQYAVKKKDVSTGGHQPTPQDIQQKNSLNAVQIGSEKSQSGSNPSPSPEKASPQSKGVELLKNLNDYIKQKNQNATGEQKLNLQKQQWTNQIQGATEKFEKEHPGDWSNFAPIVTHALTKFITKPLAGAASVTRSVSKLLPGGDYAKDSELYDKNGNLTEYGKTVNDGKTTDYLGKLITGLDSYNNQTDKEDYLNPLPRTFLGNTVGGLVGLAPTVGATALFPEGEAGEALSPLAKLKQVTVNPFTKISAIQGGLDSYDKAKQKGKSDPEALLEAGKGAVTEGGQAALYNVLGEIGGNFVSPKIAKYLTENGIAENGKLTKMGADAVSDALVFSAYPIASDLIQGKQIDWNNVQSNLGMGLLFGGLKAIKTGGEFSEADQQLKQGVALHNFMDASPEAIIEAHDNPHNPADLQAMAVDYADKARKETDLEKRKQLIAASSVYGKLANVKTMSQAILVNKDGFIKNIQESDLSDENKQKFIDKVNETHKNLDPTEKQKTDLGKQINDTETQITELSKPTGDYVKDKENEYDVKQLKEKKDNLDKQLDSIISKQKGNEKGTTQSEGGTQENGRPGQQMDERPTVDEKGEEKGSRIEQKPNEEVKTGDEKSPITERSDADIEKRMSDIEVSRDLKDKKEFKELEDEMERRERSSIFNSPLEKIEDVVERLQKKDKEMPNGFGSFIEKREGEEAIQVANRYLNKDKLSDSDVRNDFKEALLGNPDTWVSDGLKLRESAKVAAERGITIDDLLGYVEKEFLKDGFSSAEAKEVIASKLSKIIKPKGEQENAVQKQSTRKVDVQPTPGNGEKVGEGNTEPKVTPEKGEEKTPQEEGNVKKTILTKRAYEGTVADDVKKYLEEKGLTRKSYSRDERSKQASAFIDKFGDDAAFRAVEAKDIEGGLATAILAQLHIKNSTAIEDLPEGSDEREEMAKKGADIIALMEKTGYYAGEYIGQLAHEYQNQGMNFASIKRQVEKVTKKSITPDQEKKIKQVVAENEKLKKQLADSEAKLIEETEKAFKAGAEEVKNESKTQKAKRIADKIRSAKIHRPDIFLTATPASVAWDAAVEITAKSVEAGGKVADAIQDGLEHIRSTDWYKSLSKSKKDEAEKEFKRAHNDTAGSTDLEDLQERFLDKKGNKFTPSEARDIWGYMKKTYLDNGTNYRDALGNVSTDLGLTYRQVSEAVVSPKLKRISEDMWVKNAQYARHRSAIKNWIDEQNASPLMKAWKQLSGKLRGVATFGHGHIFLGTHAAMTTFFRPSVWNKTIPAFLRGFKLAYGSEAYYSRAMEELKHSDNYLIAQRAGLKNDPDRINVEEFQKSQQYLGKLGHIGERGFNTIKILRQHLFDYEYNRLSPEQRDNPKALQEIASLANLATGATNLKLPKWVNEVSFAGGMEAARWEKLTKNPAKALNTAYKAIFDPENATTEEKVFAKVWSRWVGEQVATYTTFLLANAALQNYINPKNPVNLTNPNSPDWGKFKFGDVTIDPTSGMRSTMQFIYKIAKIPVENKKELHNEKRMPLLGKDLAEYARGKLAPAYSTAADFFSGQDFGGNIMPTSNDKVPKGKHKVTWGEYAWQKAPLPAAEAANIFYESAQEHGAHKKTLDNFLKGLLFGAGSFATGVRVGEYDASKKKKNNYSIKDSK